MLLECASNRASIASTLCLFNSVGPWANSFEIQTVNGPQSRLQNLFCFLFKGAPRFNRQSKARSLVGAADASGLPAPSCAQLAQRKCLVLRRWALGMPLVWSWRQFAWIFCGIEWSGTRKVFVSGGGVIWFWCFSFGIFWSLTAFGRRWNILDNMLNTCRTKSMIVTKKNKNHPFGAPGRSCSGRFFNTARSTTHHDLNYRKLLFDGHFWREPPSVFDQTVLIPLCQCREVLGPANAWLEYSLASWVGDSWQDLPFFGCYFFVFPRRFANR